MEVEYVRSEDDGWRSSGEAFECSDYCGFAYAIEVRAGAHGLEWRAKQLPERFGVVGAVAWVWGEPVRSTKEDANDLGTIPF